MPEYILPLSSAEATLPRAGGKGSNLAKLARAGFPVPAGFIVTTGAYCAFVAANRLQSRILDLVGSISPHDPAALETTSAEIRALFEEGIMPSEVVNEITSAYHTMPGKLPASHDSSVISRTNPHVAVRSSATAEDLPGLAFAGQQETYLNIVGEVALIEAVKRCWSSLWTGRAMAYRARSHVPSGDVALAVVVQEMVQAEVSGVLFTANPVTGRRDETVIDASFGLGEAIVSGQVDPDHYVVDRREWKITRRKLGAKEIAVIPRTNGGIEHVKRQSSQEQALPDASVIELARAGQGVATHFGLPQDIEWAWAGGQFCLLQSRPITTLYPLPQLPERAKLDKGPRLYINFNAIQGVTDPLTPLGIDALRLIFGAVRDLLQIESSPRHFLPEASGRLFLDFTDLVGDRRLRNMVPLFLARVDPGAQQIVQHLIEEERFAPKVVLTPRRAITLVRALLPLLRSVLAALLWPEKVRPRVLAGAEQFVTQAQNHARAATGLAARLRAMERDLPRAERVSLAVMPTVLPAFAAVPVVDRWLTRWLGEKPGMALQLMRGLPGNLTIEMNLKLWGVAQKIRADATALESMQTQPPESLAQAYCRGALPPTAQATLDEFMREYGMRGVAEIDLGRLPWREDPTQLIQALLGYLRLEDPDLAPDVLFHGGAAQVERLAREYVARARKTRFGWLRARLLAGTIRRMRILGGLREVPLFYLARVNDIYRTRCPVFSRVVAWRTPTTAGMPYSRATTEPCVINPPISITSPPAVRNNGVQPGSVEGQTRISPGSRRSL